MNLRIATYVTTVIVAVASTVTLAAAQSNNTGASEAHQRQETEMTTTAKSKQHPKSTHAYVGMWVTKDGYIRHELLPNGRYDEARGTRRSAYQGRYEITGDHIDYVDDTGFTADGVFRDDVLYHAGMVLRRER